MKKNITGSRLMDRFMQKMSKLKLSDDAEEFEVLYPTGFLALDYLNGMMIHVKSPQINMSYRSIGIVDGSAVQIIARSGTGKSTLMFQIIANIARQFEDGELYIDDIEGSLPMSRKEFLLGMTREELAKKVRFRNTGITTENVYQRIKAIHDIKIENKDDYIYDTGLYDTEGNRIFKMIPTIYCIDSFAMLLPDEIMEKDKLDGGMGATAVAKKNTQLIKKISQLLREAGIILITVNHILDAIQNGPMPAPAQVSGLKVGERLPGGRTVLYIANNMFRMDDKGTLKADEGYGIDGGVVDITIVKSRTNRNKRAIPLIFNKTEGYFDPDLSMLHLLKTEGRIGGIGNSCYFDTDVNAKFSKKTFKQDLMNNPDLQVAYAKAAREVLDPLLFDNETKVAPNKSFDLLSAINNIFSNNATTEPVLS